MDVEELSNRQRILYEIEQLLDMQDQDQELETVRKNSAGKGRTKIPNRDIYRILKAVNQCRDVKPRIVYTGQEILDIEQVEEMEEEIPQLEPSM